MDYQVAVIKTARGGAAIKSTRCVAYSYIEGIELPLVETKTPLIKFGPKKQF